MQQQTVQVVTGGADPMKTGVWTHGLCGCFDNLGVCIITYFVPCVTFGQTREKLRGEGCFLYGCLYGFIPLAACILETMQRGEIRDRRGIPGSTCGDCMTVLCCPLCALVQEEQEAIAMQQQQGQGTTVMISTTTSGGMAPPPQQYPGQPQYPPPGQQYPPAGPQYAQYPPGQYPPGQQPEMQRK